MTYIFPFSFLTGKEKKESHRKVKKKCKENEEKEEQDRRKPFRKLDQLTAFMPNLLINILLINYGLRLSEIWDSHQANYIGNYLLKYPAAVTRGKVRIVHQK